MQGGTISQKNSRKVIILREAADFSFLDQQIFKIWGHMKALNLFFHCSSALGSECVAAQNVEVTCMRPAQLRKPEK